MARPQKQTVDYFPHDANASDSDTLTVLQGRWGNDGYAFWFRLLEKLANSEGHVIDCRNPLKWQLLLAKTQLTEETGEEMMKVLTDLNAIDPELWRKHRLIWCQSLVDDIADVYKNRRRPLPVKPIATEGNAITTEKTPITTEQSKLKKTKVNNNYTVIFKLWNSLEIIKHKKLTADIKRAIDRALRDFSLEVVSQAIKNYAEILKGDQYYFKYSWTLKDFLKRGLDKFLDLEIAKRNYGGDRDGAHRGHSTKLPPRGGYAKPRRNPKLDKLVEQERAAGQGPGSDKPG